MLHLIKQGTGFPLVFFHGWGFDSSVWMGVIPYLAADYELIFVDLPGFGQTNLMDWEQFKADLLKQLPRTFAVVGWSLGGLYGTRLAIESPEQVSHLFNVTSSPKFLAEGAWPGVSPDLLHQFYNNIVENPLDTLKEFVYLQANKTDMDVIEPRQESLLCGLDILNTWDLRQHLQDLMIPTAYLFGRLDPITPITVMQALQQQHPNFHYTLFKKSAHMPFLSHVEDFTNELRNFIR